MIKHTVLFKMKSTVSQQEIDVIFSKMMEPPSIKEVYYWIAKLGGYISRNTDAPPGIISIWRGWMRFMNLVEDYQLLCG